VGIQPFVYATTGNDNRVVSPPQFGLFGFEDSAADNVATVGTGTGNGAFPIPVTLWDSAVLLFDQQFQSGFIGSVQPATAFDTSNPPLGRVLFGGVRFNQIGSITPCRSSFDSVIFALAAQTGGVGFDISSGTNPAMFTYTGAYLTSINILASGTSPTSTNSATVAPTFASAGAPPPPPPPAGLNSTPTTSSTVKNIVTSLPAGAGLSSIPATSFVQVCQ
jgi:hypothetical protein